MSIEATQLPLRQGVILALRRDDSRWLVVRRAACVERAPLKLGFPGGEIEHGESHEQALIREAHEELNILIQPLRPIWQYDLPDRPWRLHAWLVQHTAGTLTPNPLEVAEVHWLTLDQAAAHPDALPTMPLLCAALRSTA